MYYEDTKPCSLKKYFKSEPRGMTPWLAQHMEIFKDILESEDVELFKREQKVDDFYIDLLLKNGNQPIVVENQFGYGDHDHLGKCITYSTLVNSNTAIWIADKFMTEHKKVIQNLNLNIILIEVDIKVSESQDSGTMIFYVYSKEKTKELYYSLLNGQLYKRI